MFHETVCSETFCFNETVRIYLLRGVWHGICSDLFDGLKIFLDISKFSPYI